MTPQKKSRRSKANKPMRIVERGAPTQTTIRRLFAVSSNRCAFPDCVTPIIDTTGTILAEVCHIHGHRPNSPRYEATQTDRERHAYDNLILMCGVHHKIVDASENSNTYTVSRLQQIKREHEARATSELLPSLSAKAIESLIESAVSDVSNSVTMDFRDATFRVGGEGGRMGGGGGGGGILTIVGTTKAPAEATSLVGQRGLEPGAGGGGGGAINFVGRPVTSHDLSLGFSVSSIFLANSAAWSAGLIYLLGAGWSYLPLPEVPKSVTITLVMIVELGKLQASTNLRLDISVLDPHGKEAERTYRDIAVPIQPELVPRLSLFHRISFPASSYGLYRIRVTSSDLQLAEHPFEIRLGPSL